MIGDYVSTEDVIAGLERVRMTLCVYYADEHHTCDCKFLKEGQSRRGSEQTGCCEIRRAVDHLRRLSKGVQPLAAGSGRGDGAPCPKDSVPNSRPLCHYCGHLIAAFNNGRGRCIVVNLYKKKVWKDRLVYHDFCYQQAGQPHGVPLEAPKTGHRTAG